MELHTSMAILIPIFINKINCCESARDGNLRGEALSLIFLSLK